MLDKKILDERIKLLTPLLLAYPNSNMTAANINVYAMALAHVPADLLEAATVKCMQKYTFFPAIAQILEEAKNLQAEITGTMQKTAAEAWAEVEKQMKRTAFTAIKPIFSTKEIEAAALGMGWDSVCRTLESDIPTLRAQFRDAYNATVKRAKEKRDNDEVLKIIPAETKERLLAAVGVALGAGKGDNDTKSNKN